MKLSVKFLLFFAIPLFSSFLIINNDTALAGYSRCKSVSETAPTPYCFKQGDSGKLIRILVEDLRAAGYYKGKTTTIFNSQVKKAVIKFQKDYSRKNPEVKVDGIVGENTLVKLCQAIGRGCGPDADYGCYTGSPVRVTECLDKYKE